MKDGVVLTSSFLCQLVQIQYSYQQSCSSLLQFDIGRVISISGCLTFLRLTMGKSRFEREISHLHPLPYTDMSHELWMDLKPDTAFTKHNEMISVKNEIWWGGVGWDRVQGTMKKVHTLKLPSLVHGHSVRIPGLEAMSTLWSSLLQLVNLMRN